MDIITLARELGKAIQQDPIYAELEAAKKLNDEDFELQKLIERFGVLQQSYEYEAGKETPDEDRLSATEAQLESLYETIMGNANMARFEGAKAKMDIMMNKIVAILAASVNGDDPMTVDPDKLIHEDECGGDCDCCGHHCHDDDCDCGDHDED